ncbi:hypothetical protein SAMN04487948_1374 [Halogranum amylolyticum]|uniref:Uncharacterized protein n=1 Tax=Halogranum amylolyticum TaxID=660520 RepID=A0A1H8WQP5_9EURY|nr:hypothetical protein SAMN04487948_1374 [Halogranum amylolyticum]
MYMGKSAQYTSKKMLGLVQTQLFLQGSQLEKNQWSGPGLL